MKAAYIAGDAIATAGVLASVTHALPAVLGGIASFMAIAWFGILFYDRFTTHVSSYDAEKYQRGTFRNWHRPEGNDHEPGPIDRP